MPGKTHYSNPTEHIRKLFLPWSSFSAVCTSSFGTLSKTVLGDAVGACEYIKLSRLDNYTNSFSLLEPLCEVFCCRLGRLFCLDIADQELVDITFTDDAPVPKTLGVSSADYRLGGTVTLTASEIFASHDKRFIDQAREFLSPTEFEKLQRIFIFDYLIGNTDRHGANIEFLISTDKIITVAPIFDCEHSLFVVNDLHSRITTDYIMREVQINSFFTSIYQKRSLQASKGVKLTVPNKIDFKLLFKDIDNYLSEEQIQGTILYITQRLEYLYTEGYLKSLPEIRSNL